MRILLPLDGSPLAEYAIGQAANLAQRAKERVELRLLRVVSLVSLAMSAPEYAIPTAITTAEAEDEDYLRQVALRPSLEHLNVTTQVVTSTAGVADTISHEAQEWHADLIVLASHGRSGIARALVGSVARDVVNQSQIPTLIFRLQDEIRSLSQIGRYTILVPLDETPFTEQALPRPSSWRKCSTRISFSLKCSLRPPRICIMIATRWSEPSVICASSVIDWHLRALPRAPV